MRADEYIVEELQKTKEQLTIAIRTNDRLREDYLNIKNKTEETIKLLDELKQYFVIHHTSDRISTIKVIYDNEALSRRNVAYNDEPIYDILLKLLGPLTEEETE